MGFFNDVVNSMQKAFDHSSQTGASYPTRSTWEENIGDMLKSSNHPASHSKDTAYLSDLISNVISAASDKIK